MNNLKEIIEQIKKSNFEEIAPNFKKGVLSESDINEIVNKVSLDIGISKADALIGIMLLMLKGAASGGTPPTLSVELKDGKTLAKKNVMGAYMSVTGNNYIRRLAEALAVQIGEFAESFGLNGELAQRINTALKAENGEMLSPKEIAWCNSFSQNIPDLANRSSERLVKLLAEDYKKRFDNKKKNNSNSISTQYQKNKSKKK